VHMPDVVERCVEVAASPAEVWEAIADPERLSEWLNVDVDMDVRPGGGARFVTPDGRRLGVVEEVVPDERLVFCWWPSPGFGRTSRVEIDLAESDRGTEVHVVETFLSVAAPSRPALRVLASA
jgi:uncharacterized protein YndB with AHSA1/START domain